MMQTKVNKIESQSLDPSVFLHLLQVQIHHFLPSITVTCLGLLVAQKLESNLLPIAWHLFFSTLLIYVFDRSVPCPEDGINNPERKSLIERHKKLNKTYFFLASIGLIIGPIIFAKVILYIFIFPGAVLCLAYTKIPFTKYRIKSLIPLKTLLPPFVITAAIICLCWLFNNQLFFNTKWFIINAWLLSVLLANVLLSDLMDVEGDQQFKIRTIPTQLGYRKSLYLTIILSIIVSILGFPIGLPYIIAGLLLFIPTILLCIGYNNRQHLVWFIDSLFIFVFIFACLQ
ncbi:MAG: UbiA family prenyltransferase [Lentisphaeria bacterium]|nr:UbiA family prenyltransferase [Lentisphaeria bacterium]